MTWFDCGVNLTEDELSNEQMAIRSVESGVTHWLAIASNIDESSALDSNTFGDSLPVKVAHTCGVHPHYAQDTNAETWQILKKLVNGNRLSAIGECGLDFNRNFSSKEQQLYAFESQLALAAEAGLGVYLHERDAFDEQIQLLEKYAASLKFMITHCFTGTKEQLQTYLYMGRYIGITGWLCDPKRGATLREAVRILPLERLLLETDSPYLFPKTKKPRRSKNEPCNIPFIAEELASVMNVPLDDIERYSECNARRTLFREGHI